MTASFRIKLNVTPWLLFFVAAVMMLIGCSGKDNTASQVAVDTPQPPTSQPTITPAIEPTAQPQTLQITPTHSLTLSIPDAIGVVIHRAKGAESDPVIFDLVEQLGVGVIRDDMRWELVETTKGVYDFSAYDVFIDRIEQLGVRVLWIVDRGNLLYEETTRAVSTQEGREAYAAFARAAAERYKGKGIIWEIWNEPNSDNFWRPEPNAQDYYELVKLTAQAIHEVDPTATVVAASSSLRPLELYPNDLQWHEDLFKLGMLDYIDAVSIHPYRFLNPPETVIDDYESLRELISKYRTVSADSLPIMSSEWGYTSLDYNRNSVLDKQAKFAIRSMLMDIALGHPVSVWYELWRPKPNELSYTLFNGDKTPKPVANALQTLTSTLDGFTYIGQVAEFREGNWALAFESEEETALVLWTTNDQYTLNVPAASDCGQLIDLYGKGIRYCWYGEKIKVKLTDEPQYLVFPRRE